MILPFRGVEPSVDATAFVAPDAAVIGDVVVGENASIWFGCVLRGDVNAIRIGRCTNIQDGSVIHVNSKGEPTVIEDCVTIGHRVVLHGCRVEPECLIGIGSIILDGARIGHRTLVAAGSLVTPNTLIPPESLVMGSPARVKRPLTAEEIAGLEESWKNYVDLSAAYKQG